jgi:hypothetical protein
MGTVTDTVDGLSASLEGISDALARSVSSLGARLAESETHLQSGLTELRAAVEKNRLNGEGTAQAIETLSGSIADLGGLLRDVSAAQGALTPIPRRLAGPLELGLTPSAERGSNG